MYVYIYIYIHREREREREREKTLRKVGPQSTEIGGWPAAAAAAFIGISRFPLRSIFKLRI